MKVEFVLILALLTLSSTQKIESSMIEKIQCLITNEVIYEYIVDIYEIIQTKDASKIISALIEAFPILKEEVLKCWNKEILLFSEMRQLYLQENKKPSPCESKCWGSCNHIFKYFEYYKCAIECIEKNCKK